MNSTGDFGRRSLYNNAVAYSGGRLPADDIYFNLPGVAIVRWDTRSQAAHMEWQGWAAPAEFRAANDALVQAIQDHHSSRVLGDSRQIKVIQKTDQDWVNGDWFPRILEAGLTRMALVIPVSGLAKMNIDDLVGRVANRLDVAYFATLDEARTWLASPSSNPPEMPISQPAVR